ncbi:hypothetical protein PISMIDRAFT_9319 [Pisolithus microcarpus 441]|uniref:DUF4100 domain-containing protein n=1 Tax=Pisolithus microcarpus 441 TaxID=765257 RepID=A0A0C9Z8Z9_9AGAM|nr:hypothetical protein PISMIDRAFT_9319 [Pisolithus microcarpus 441]
MDPNAAKVICPPALHSTPVPSSTVPPISPNSSQAHPPRKPIICFGCGVTGHGLDSCNAINDLVKKGSLARDDNHQVIYPNGQHIYRNGDETILQAYERSVNVTQPTNTVHFVIHEEADEYLGAEIYELEDEAVVAAAERNAKILKDKCREVFDGVLLPPQSHGKGKEREFLKQSTSSTPVNQPQPPIKPSSAPIHQPSKQADLTPVTQPHATITAPQAPVFVPVDVHCHGFDGNNDDAIMEDESINKPSHQASDSPADKGRKSKPTAAMTSPLSQSADPKAIVDCILATPMTLSLGEVIGASRNVSHHLQELIRYKRQPIIQSVRAVDGTPLIASYLALTSSPLITINLTCNG